MFALVKLYFVCPLNSVSKNDQGTYCAKFKDGAYYDADIVTTHGSFNVLEKLKHSLCSNQPRIVLSRCDLNTSIKLEQNEEFESDTSAGVVKREITTEEYFNEEEEIPNLIDHYTGFNASTNNGSVNEMSWDKNLYEIEFDPPPNIVKEEISIDDSFTKEEQSFTFIDHQVDSKTVSANEKTTKKNLYLESLNSNVLAKTDSVIVNDILLKHTCKSNVMFQDHNYSPFFLEKPEKQLLHDTASLDDSQNLLQADENDSDEEMHYAFSFPKETIENDHDNISEDPASLQINGINSPYCNIHTTEIICNSSSVPSPEESLPQYNESENEVPASRRRSKRSFCVYCKKLVLALPRHLQTVHKDEEKQFISLPKGIERHNRDCSSNKEKDLHNMVAPENITYRRIHTNPCPVLVKHIFPFLKETELGKMIQYDSLAIAYGNFICAKYNQHKHYCTIRSRLRSIGNLIIETKRLDSTIRNFASLMAPAHIDLIMQAINNLAGLDEKGLYGAPSIAESLKYICTDAAEVLKKECAKNKDLEGSQQADAFLKSFKLLTNSTIRKRVLRNREIDAPDCKRKKVCFMLKEKKEMLCQKYEDNGEDSRLDSCSANADTNFGNTIADLNNVIKEKVFEKETNFDSDVFKRLTDVISDIPDHGSNSNHQYPVYVPTKENNIDDDVSDNISDDISDSKFSKEFAINTLTEIQKGNIPLAEEPLPFYNQEAENKLAVAPKKQKHYFCVYCKTLYTNLPRHLERKHREEEAVKQFCSFPIGSKQRQTILKEISRRSSFIYNTNRNYNTTGELIVTRRPVKGKFDANEYVPCPNCKGFYLKRTLRKHYRFCSSNTKTRRNVVIPLAKVTHGQIHSSACEDLRKDIFPYLKDAEHVKIIRYDNLAIAYGNYLCNKYKNLKYQYLIRSNLRYVARLLIETKQLDPSINDFASLMVPSCVNTVMKAINNVAGLDKNGHYRAPSTADNLRRICKDAAELWKLECLKHNDAEGEKQADNFLRCFIPASFTKIYTKVKQNMLERVRVKLNLEEEKNVSSLECTRQRWSWSTKTDFYKMFQHHLENKTLPSNKQCQMAMQNIPALRSKTVAALKTAVQNEIRRRERHLK